MQGRTNRTTDLYVDTEDGHTLCVTVRIVTLGEWDTVARMTDRDFVHSVVESAKLDESDVGPFGPDDLYVDDGTRIVAAYLDFLRPPTRKLMK